MSIRIYRRLFNDPQAPELPEGKRDKEKRIQKTRELVATFIEKMEQEANACLAYLQRNSTSMLGGVFESYRYTLEKDPPPRKPIEEIAGLQVDTTKATPTKRPIKFTFSWEVIHTDNVCHCLAWNQRYGAVRGEVENSVAGRLKFILAIRKVWPDAIKLDQAT